IRAAQTATQSIPIVMGAVSDPLGIGLIAGLARPGGNTTGLSILSTELTVKRLELLREVMPQAVRIAILQQPANPGHPIFIKEIEPTAGLLGFIYRIWEARGSEDFAPSFALMRAWPADAIFVLDDASSRDHVRVRGQPQNCKGFGFRCLTDLARPRRRGDRIRKSCCNANVRFWH